MSVHSHKKFHDMNSIAFGYDKMSEFMCDNDHTENNNKQNN